MPHIETQNEMQQFTVWFFAGYFLSCFGIICWIFLQVIHSKRKIKPHPSSKASWSYWQVPWWEGCATAWICTLWRLPCQGYVGIDVGMVHEGFKWNHSIQIWETPGLKLNPHGSYSYPYPYHLGNSPTVVFNTLETPGAQYNLETVGPYARLHLTVHRASKLFLGFCPSWCLDLLTLIPSLKNMPPAALTADSLASKARARYMWNIWSLCGSVC